ncbi:MAG: FAD:protein FMN transferase [Dysgonamonadaceae bacterium]|jgi:thiamine biosynthesis lipoprotein|nr:FAD:protein FMN transferase [Dysgonamonadaceae bacterium]
MEKRKRQMCAGRLFLPLLFLLFLSCSRKESYYLTQGEIFKTTAHIKYQYHRDLGKEIRACLDSFDLSLNPFNPGAIIYKVNHNENVAVDDRFITVFNKAQEIAALTGGIYDITCAPLINLWGFGFEKKGEITPRAIDSIKQFTGYQKVRLEGRKVVKDHPSVQLNASSIAKGYACDVVAGLFDAYGITNYMVEIGGEVHARGENPAGKCWNIEILKPIDDSTGTIKEQQEVICLHNRSLATSGNYRNFYIKDGKKYGHTINPLTGYPAGTMETGHYTPLLSATVLYSDCMTADAFATAFMALGLERAVALAGQFPEMDYLFIYADDKGEWLERRSRFYNFMKQ